MEDVPTVVVEEFLLAGKTYNEISCELKQLYHHITRGFSERSIRRYVKENNLKEAVKGDMYEAVKESE